MDLKSKGTRKYSSIGSGARTGSVIKEEFFCPCGKGTVFYERDEIPGFKNTFITSDCKECREYYSFGNGTAELK